MNKILNFLIETQKLKELRRVGWVLMGVEKAETVASHTFRLAIFAWLMAKKMRLNAERAMKIALFHDLCEAYAGDITTLLYHPQLSREKDKEKRKKIEMKWARLSHQERSKIGKIKFEKEKKAILKLLNILGSNSKTKKEMFSLWIDYEKGVSREGKMIRELNMIETLIQSIEYFGIDEKKSGTTWWEGTEEIVESPLLLEFLNVIQKKFYGKKVRVSKDLEGILDFLLRIGKLKNLPQKGWALRGVKNPETVAEHTFTFALMSWFFAKEKEPRLNKEKILKMAFCHKISSVYTNDRTPYDRIIQNKDKKEVKEIFKKWIRLSQKEKAENFLADYKEDKAALEKLVGDLDKNQRREIIQLWEEYKNISSPESRFLNRMKTLTVLFLALLYWKKDKNFPIESIWEWAFEVSDGQHNFDFMEELKKKFHRKRFPFSSSLDFFVSKLTGNKR